MRFKRASEDGFSIIEVVIAVVVLFFALTALYALTVSSYRQSVTASRQSVATNFVSSMFEQARSMPFNGLGTDASGDVYGSLLSQETTTYQGIEFTIERNVAWVDDAGDGTGASDADDDTHDYKEYIVTVHWTTMVSIPHSLTMSTYIRNTAGENVVADIDLEWVRPPTPVEDAVIFGTGVWDGVRATSPTTDDLASLAASTTISTLGDGIQWVKFTVDSLVIYNMNFTVSTPEAPDPRYAEFFPEEDPSHWEGYFDLDSLGTMELTPTLLFPDGPRELEVTVMSLSGGTERSLLNIIVDNGAPFFGSEASPSTDEVPSLGEPDTNAARYDAEIRLEYPVASDGWLDFDRTVPYAVTRWKVGVQTGYNGGVPLFSQEEVLDAALSSSGTSQGSSMSDGVTTFSTSPFTAYRMRLWPRSVTGRMYDPGDDFHTDWYITNSRLDPDQTTRVGQKQNPKVLLHLESNNLTQYLSGYPVENITYDVFSGSSAPSGIGNLSTAVASGLTYDGLLLEEIPVTRGGTIYLQVRANLPQTLQDSDQAVVWSNVIQVYTNQNQNSGSITVP